MLLGVVLLGGSALPPGDQGEQVRAFTREIEFNYLAWGLSAIKVKVNQLALNVPGYMTPEEERDLVGDYLDIIQRIQQGENHLDEIYADPNIPDPASASVLVRGQLDELYTQRARLGPLAEAILQGQVSEVIAELDLALGGQSLPPILYHSSPLPLALIVSPRYVISQDENISLQPELSVDQKAHLEEQVARALDVSSLVVEVGGIGIYPTMVIETTDMKFLTEVVAHEWIHNILSLRPLGISYLNSPDLRTMNETAASIAGKEIGQAVMARYYPELLPPPTPRPPAMETSQETPSPPIFDFRAEMHQTRVTVDKLLAEGHLSAAEAYMEERRIFFWEHGYRIRKLNQAYFAFHGAYADEPGGAAGEDPVGAAVRTLRANSVSLADFLNRISWMSSFEQLQKAIEDSGLGLDSTNLPVVPGS